MFLIYFIILSYAYALTYIDTYFKQSFEKQYEVPGKYILSPKDYKYAPTIFVLIYGGGGGTDLAYLRSDVGCIGQNGAYLSVLINTHSGTSSFNVITGKGGIGSGPNITGCKGLLPVYNMTDPSTGEDSSIISSNGKIWAIAKGGTRATAINLGQIISCTRFEGKKSGYTNISFGYGIVFLERQNGEDGYFDSYLAIDNTKSKLVNFPPCAINHTLSRGRSGKNGLVRVIPIAVPINILLGSGDIQPVDINFYVRN